MLVAILTDTHAGVRAQSPLFLQHYADFHKNIFFPYLDKHKIRTVFHGGDLVDHRKFITYNVSRVLRESYIEPSLARGIQTHAIVGNHDSFHKSSIEINALTELLPEENFSVYTSPTDIVVGGKTFLMLPWICQENEEESVDALKTSQSEVVLGHLELIGFEQYRGLPAQHGMDVKLLDRFPRVFSGHYHHPSEKGNIRYLGAPYQMTWGDYDCQRGFHVYNTETNVLQFIPNPVEVFQKIEYDDSNKTIKQIMQGDFSVYEKKIIKVVVSKKENKKGFEKFIDEVEKSGASDIQIVEPTTHTPRLDDPIVADEGNKTTRDIILESVDEFDESVDKDALRKELSDLYSQALELQE